MECKDTANWVRGFFGELVSMVSDGENKNSTSPTPLPEVEKDEERETMQQKKSALSLLSVTSRETRKENKKGNIFFVELTQILLELCSRI